MSTHQKLITRPVRSESSTLASRNTMKMIPGAPCLRDSAEEAPVHYLNDSANGPFWSVTSHALIKEVDANNSVFSSEKGGISIVDLKPVEGQVQGKNFIAMDEPEHSIQRNAVAPSVAPKKPGRARTSNQRARNRHPRKFACRRNLQLGPGSIDRAYGENANHDFGLSL